MADAQAVASTQLPQWQLQETLQRSFSMASYLQGAEFVARIAALAESEDHHPDVTLAYKRVDVALTTHSVQAVSVNDFIMAAKVQQLWHEFS